MAEQPGGDGGVPEPVGSDELNAWKRGFTPQAEIWNGRLAMIGLSAGLAVILLVRVFAGGGQRSAKCSKRSAKSGIPER